MPPAQEEGCPTAHRIFVILVGGGAFQRASICHAGQSDLMHIEPINGVGELSLRDLTSVDVLLAWNEHDIIEELKSQLAIVARWCPIVAISEGASVPQVVRAMKAGAIDYIDWQGDFGSLRAAVAVAHAAKCKLLPQKQRQMDVRHRLQQLTRRELEVLTAITQGKSNKQIANLLRISPRTVDIHRGSMMRKLQANSVADAVRMALDATATGHWVFGDTWLSPWSLDHPFRDKDDQ